ncbi:hypothetical protein [Mycolicibacterium obuense]|uniref:Uncharacterized protein n=1 Tax=Mycolicibacterium obuense TaxID=1807 RepID=A0A0M2JZU5_9MYCO|nr:hypothetical protein [Mycolicibacterium obuense]KKF00465.1 hypothetical protein WN67_18670 [Mycolicibacterium obuense]
MLEREGRTLLLPWRCTVSMTAQALGMRRNDYGLTSLSWVPGRAEPSGEPVLVIVFDTPEQTCEAVATKPEQELHDVNMFLLDCVPPKSVTGASVPSPTDPPDVLVSVDSAQFGVEATHLLLPESNLDKSQSIIGRWMMFERLRDAILRDCTAADFAQHVGLHLIVWFGELDERRLPPRRARDIEAALSAIKAVTPPPPGPMEMSDEPDGIRWSPDRTVGFSWGYVPLGYRSPFFDAMGFELGLAYDVTILREDLRAELRRLISDHDNDKADVLLVTTNAPLRSGLEFPSSRLITDMLFDDDNPLDGYRPQHVGLVALHDQGGGRVRWLLGPPPWDE